MLESAPCIATAVGSSWGRAQKSGSWTPCCGRTATSKGVTSAVKISHIAVHTSQKMVSGVDDGTTVHGAGLVNFRSRSPCPSWEGVDGAGRESGVGSLKHLMPCGVASFFTFSFTSKE